MLRVGYYTVYDPGAELQEINHLQLRSSKTHSTTNTESFIAYLLITPGTLHTCLVRGEEIVSWTIQGFITQY